VDRAVLTRPVVDHSEPRGEVLPVIRIEVLVARVSGSPLASGSAGRAGVVAGQRSLSKVTYIHHQLVGPAEVEGVARLAELWPDLRAGFDRACMTGDRQLAGALVRPVAGEVNLRRQTEVSDWAERILALTPADDDQQIVFWLGVAANRYKQIGDHDGFERLVNRHGQPDHVVVRYARANLVDDGEALNECSAEAWPGSAAAARTTPPHSPRSGARQDC